MLPLEGKKLTASAAWLTAFLQGQRDMLQAASAADRNYLNSLIDGSGDFLAEDTFARLEPMFSRYEFDQPMTALLETTAQAYWDAAVTAACWMLAGQVIDEARRDWTDL